MKQLRWFLTIVAGLVVLVFIRPFSPKWVVETQPTGDGFVLRVRLSTEKHFRYEGRVEGNWSHVGGAKTVVLGLYSANVPGGEVTFSDTTLLPGAFRARFGEKTLAISENGFKLIDH